MSDPAVQTALPPIDSLGVLSRSSGRLAEASSVLELTAELGAIVERLVGPGARFELFTLDEDAELTPLAHPADSSSRGLLATLRARRLASREFLTEPRSVPGDRRSGSRAVMTAPLSGPGGTLTGLLVVEGPAHGPDFGTAQLVALECVAATAAVGLREIASAGASSERRRLDRSTSRRIQRGLMSSILPPGAGVSALVEYRPAFDVGGDFYGVRRLENGAVVATIGDVSGNGVSAALVMARVVSELDRAVATVDSPSAALLHTHLTLDDLPSDMFVTAACLRVDLDAGLLTVANAGHPPLVVRRANGDVFSSGDASGAPLAVLDGAYQDERIPAGKGDIVLLVTDGVLEALDHPSGQQGMDRLLGLVRESPGTLPGLQARLHAAVDRAGRKHPLDDCTWVALRIDR